MNMTLLYFLENTKKVIKFKTMSALLTGKKNIKLKR